jgi:arsenite methyltransferase
MNGKPDYGIDAPGVLRNLFVIGVALLPLGYFLPTVRVGPVIFGLRPMFWATGVFCIIEGFLMFIYVKSGKFAHRDRMLSLVTWRGDETVLDVGTGRGLLMIGAAKKLTTGKSFGIDIWNAQDLSDNRVENTLRNAELEGVRDRVEIRNEDASTMKFSDATFEVVLSNLCLHNIPTREGRDRACREIVRVLKPGGVAVISDFIRTGDYAGVFRSVGLEVQRTRKFFWNAFPPLVVVRAVKPR